MKKNYVSFELAREKTKTNQIQRGRKMELVSGKYSQECWERERERECFLSFGCW